MAEEEKVGVADSTMGEANNVKEEAPSASIEVDDGEVVLTADGGNEADAEPEAIKASSKIVLEEPDMSLVGVKICKDFDMVPYIGEIKSARKSVDGPLYKIVYRDGDEEEFFSAEVQEGQEKYVALASEMWDALTTVVEGLDVEVLKGAGVTSISQLELFGGGATNETSGTPFDSLDLPLLTKQQLSIIATYLLNDQILTKDSKMDEMARFNLAKRQGKVKQPRERKTVTKKTVVVKAKKGRAKRAAPKQVVQPTTRTRGRPKNASEPMEEDLPAKKPAAKLRPPPKVRTPTVGYKGPPKDPLNGVEDWPGSASEGWTYELRQRGSSSRFEKYWTSPGGNTFRSDLEVRKYLVALKQNDGNEVKAKKVFESIKL